MPRIHPLPKHEAEICRRLRAFRESIGVPRTVFAQRSELDVALLVRIEHLLVPLKWRAYKSIDRHFPINPFWLRHEEGLPKSGFPYDDSDFATQINDESLFSEVYDRFLTSQMVILAQAHRQDFQNLIADMRLMAAAAKRGGVLDLPHDVITEMVSATDELRESLKQLLSDAVKTGKCKSGSVLEGQEPLDNKKPLPQSADVQNKFRTFGELLDHLRKITKPRGAKAELARRFKVSRQAVDQWLRGEAKPSAEIAIELQHWMPRLEK